MLIHWQLFYTKRSQYVSGTEAEKVAVSVGQKVSAETNSSQGA